MDEALEDLMKDIGRMMSAKDKKIQELEGRVKSLETKRPNYLSKLCHLMNGKLSKQRMVEKSTLLVP